MSNDLNSMAFDRIVASRPWLTGVRPAAEIVSGMEADLILHAGPPVTWAKMSPVLRSGLVGAALFEGLADTPAAAQQKAASGAIRFGAAQDHGCMAGGVGAITASMPVMVVEDRTSGEVSSHFVMEGLGRTLVSGFYDESVLARLRWLRDSCGPTVDAALRAIGGIDLRPIIIEALRRGDELHNRNAAATGMLALEIARGLLDVDPNPSEHKRVLTFLSENPQFFVGVSLPAAQLMLRAAHNIPGCAVVTAIAANGTDCGIKISGLGDRWFVAPVDRPHGVLSQVADLTDVAPACGDSFLGEFAGFGASILPGAPTLQPLIGATAADAARYAASALSISLGQHPVYRVPALEDQGTPVGVDARAVVRSGTLPVIDIVMSHRTPGVGMIGMGLVSPPIACFQQGLSALDGVSGLHSGKAVSAGLST